jgi:hypothetical protein
VSDPSLPRRILTGTITCDILNLKAWLAHASASDEQFARLLNAWTPAFAIR